MNSFIQKHQASVIGVLSGFDRLRFRGSLRWLYSSKAVAKHLGKMKVLLKDFKPYVESLTQRLREATIQLAQSLGRPLRYLPSSATSKEEQARQIAEQDGIEEGLICILSCVEPCWSVTVCLNRQSGELEPKVRQRKCLHYYHYWIHPQFGFMHARLQTWLPFDVRLCLNGREWLARQMDAAGISYLRRGNCFVDISDIHAAQQLANQQLRVNWRTQLDNLIPQFNPAHAKLFPGLCPAYYWSIEESEWATDVMFRSAATLKELFPRFVKHGMEILSSRDVMRFLGRAVPAHGSVNKNFTGEVVTDMKDRPEGMRIKHSVDRNSLKAYNKWSLLRVETTMNNPKDFKEYRSKEGDQHGPKKWRTLRKGVAGIHRRVQVSQAANARYLDSLATVDHEVTLDKLAGKLCQPVKWKGKRVRALNPLSTDDATLLTAVCRGEFLIRA